MTERPTEQMIGFRIKKQPEPAHEVDRAITAHMGALSEVIKEKKAVQICELSRALADEVDHAFSHPEVWPHERVEDTTRLLEQAASATVGTPYEDNCAARPADFKIRLESLLDARKAFQKILDAQQSVSPRS